jgi:hypothetical protein
MMWVVLTACGFVFWVKLHGMKDDRAADRLIRGYAAAVAGEGYNPLTIYDTSILPVPKDEIARRYLKRISEEKDAAKRTALETTLLTIAQFQPGVGEPKCHPTAAIVESLVTEKDQAKRHDLIKFLTAGSADASDAYDRLTKAVDREQAFLFEAIEKARIGTLDVGVFSLRAALS